MKFVDYLNKCLKNTEFKKYWDEGMGDVEIPGVDFYSLSPMSVQEALRELSKDDLNNILVNKGLKKNIVITTDIEFFEQNNECPVADFISSIEVEKLKEKVLEDIARLGILGNDARKPLSCYIRDGIYELRTIQSNNITRIFYFFVFGNKIILTNGYIKTSQKMDDSEFEKAKNYMNSYLQKEVNS